LFPIVIGMTTNRFFPKFVKAILPFAPVVGVVSTCLLVASSVAQVSAPILAAGWSLQFSLLALHLIGGLAGYIVPKATGFGETSCRTMAIETSMKSSAFAFLLAKLHFGDYTARIAPAVSVVWMALTGSMLAVYWRYKPVPEGDKDNFSLGKLFKKAA
jgi:BASS family bile acid:Na+ symporter